MQRPGSRLWPMPFSNQNRAVTDSREKKAEALKVRRANEGCVQKAGEDAMRRERLKMKREATSRLESKDPKKAKDGRKARKERALANPKGHGPMAPPMPPI